MILLSSCTQRTQKAKGYQTVRIDTIVSADKQTFLQFPGKVKAAQDISLAFRVSGTISKIHVKDGARVQEGQLLAELDPTDYQVQLDATEAEYQQIKAEAERVMALYKDNGTTPSANDKAVYGLKQITAKYKHHKDQLAYTRLYALSTGTGETYPLKLISVTPKANANQLYTMRLQVVPGTRAIPSPGMNTMVTILCRTEQENTLSVPTGAILQKEGKAYVFVFHPSSNTVHRQEVSILRLLNNGHSLITSRQLQPGEQIVSSGVHHIEDGEIVKPLSPVTNTNIGGLL